MQQTITLYQEHTSKNSSYTNTTASAYQQQFAKYKYYIYKTLSFVWLFEFFRCILYK